MTTSVDTAADTGQPEVLRNQMVDDLLLANDSLPRLASATVEAVMRKVPREEFLPGVPLPEVYKADDVVRIKLDENGNTISSASAPWLVALMLQEADVRPGHRVFEVGTASGINACYLSRLVGETGEVVSVEFDGDLIDSARRGLAATECTNVEVIHGDGEHGAPGRGVFDRVIVTVQSGDLAKAWMDQLAPDGLMVVPLYLRGISRSVTFEPEGDHWRSRAAHVCGFVDMQGEGACSRQVVTFDDGVFLRVYEGQDVDAQAMTDAMATPAHQVWTGVPTPGIEFTHLDFWLAATLGNYGRYIGTGDAVKEGRFGQTVGLGGTATWDGDTLAYVTYRKTESAEGFEFGAWAHGPNREQLAARLAGEIRRWAEDRRGGPEPTVRAYRAGTPDDQLAAGQVVDLRHTRIVLCTDG